VSLPFLWLQPISVVLIPLCELISVGRVPHHHNLPGLPCQNDKNLVSPLRSRVKYPVNLDSQRPHNFKAYSFRPLARWPGSEAGIGRVPSSPTPLYPPVLWHAVEPGPPASSLVNALTWMSQSNWVLVRLLLCLFNDTEWHKVSLMWHYTNSQGGGGDNGIAQQITVLSTVRICFQILLKVVSYSPVQKPSTPIFFMFLQLIPS